VQVFATFKGGFGDAWGASNFFLRKSVETNAPTLVSRLDPRVRQILPLLESSGTVQAVDDEPDVLIYYHPTLTPRERGYSGVVPTNVLDWTAVFGHRYFSTRRAQWQGGRRGRVCFQLVPRDPSSPKACRPGEVDGLLSALRSAGHQTVALGLPMALEETIDLVAACEYFVGVCSGMSHLCHSVGIPVHLIRNGLSVDEIHRHHGGNQYTCYPNAQSFLSAQHLI
jgi:hypothetical protein